MSISYGPYRSSIPLVNVEEVQLRLAQQDVMYAQGIIRTGSAVVDDTLEVTVQLSNEIVPSEATWGSQIKVGNWIFFTTDHNYARNLTEWQQGLARDMITITQSGGIDTSSEDSVIKMKLVLDKNEFKETGMTTRTATSAAPLAIRTHKTRRTLRIPGYVLPDLSTTNLYMVVASFSQHKTGAVRVGNVVSHTILEGGQVPERSNLYILDQTVPTYGQAGSIWPITVNEDGGQLQAGSENQYTSPPRIRAVEVPNIKVKDMRILTLVKNTSPNFVPPNAEKPYISPLLISRGSSGNAHGMFSFDLEAYIATNSSLAGIMTNTASLLNSVVVKDIVIWQKPSGRSTTGTSLTPVGATYCGISATRDYVRVASLGDGCEILNTLSDGNSILNVSFVDETVTRRGTGAAQYKVEMVLADRAQEVISSTAQQLNQMISQSSNRLRLGRERGNKDLYARTAEVYLNLIEYLFGLNVFAQFTKAYWKSNMMAMLYGPQQGDQEKMQLMTAMAAFVQQLNNLVQKAPMATVTATNFRSTIGSANKQSLLTFRHTFKEKLLLQGVASLGLGYVDSNIQNGSSAVPQIFHETYRSRAYQERDKYNITDPNATNVNNFGFLSPAWIGLGERGRVMTPSLSLSNNSVLGLMNDSLNMRIENSGPSHETIQVQQLNTLRSVGIGVTALKVPLKKEVVAPDVVAPETPDASEYLSANSAFYLANRERFSEISGSQRIIIRSRRDVLATSPLVAKVVNQAMVDFTPAPVMINADLLPGSIAAIKNTEDTTLVPTYPATTAVVNFGSIAKVQYLAPYSAELGVESQIWRTLDSVTFESAVEDSRPLICRLIKVTTVTSINEGLKLEPLAKYFVLGPITVRSTTQLPLPDLAATDEGRSYVDELEEIGDEILYSCNPVFNLPTGGN